MLTKGYKPKKNMACKSLVLDVDGVLIRDKHLLEHIKGFQPSTNWCIGGPIIELMCMHISRTNKTDKEPWAACMTNWIDGATPLEAAMRCYAAYRLGDQVDIPEELR